MPRKATGNPPGRPQGSKTFKSAEFARKAAEQFGWPVPVMLAEMSELYAEAQAIRSKKKSSATEKQRARKLGREAAAIARDAAPYCHPKLASIQHSGDEDHPLLPPIDDRELARRIALILSRADPKRK